MTTADGFKKNVNFATSVKSTPFSMACVSPVTNTRKLQVPGFWTIFGAYLESESVPGSGPGTERYSGNKAKFETALKLKQK